MWVLGRLQNQLASMEEGLCASLMCPAFVVWAMECHVRFVSFTKTHFVVCLVFFGGGEVAGSINEKRQECEVWGWTVSEETLALVR